MRVSDDNGSTYKSSGYAYQYTISAASASAADFVQSYGSGTAAGIFLSPTATTTYLQGYVDVFSPDQANNLLTAKFDLFNTSATNTSGQGIGIGYYATQDAINAIEFFAGTHNFTAGTIYLYGISC